MLKVNEYICELTEKYERHHSSAATM